MDYAQTSVLHLYRSELCVPASQSQGHGLY